MPLIEPCLWFMKYSIYDGYKWDSMEVKRFPRGARAAARASIMIMIIQSTHSIRSAVHSRTSIKETSEPYQSVGI